MNKELAIKWVAELRSGRWPQGRAFLNNGGRLCCLGVLCEVMVTEGLAERHQVGAAATKTFTYRAVGEATADSWTAYPVASLQKIAGVVEDITDSSGGFKVTYNGRKVDLYVLNDREGLSFAAIADVIEKEWILGN